MGACWRTGVGCPERKAQFWFENPCASGATPRQQCDEKCALRTEPIALERKKRSPSADAEDDEERTFLRILELLEEQDEYETNQSDEDVASTAGDESSGPDEEGIDGDASMTGYRPLEDWELVAAWEDLKLRRLPSRDVAARLIKGVGSLYAASPSLVHLGRPAVSSRLIVVGDLHGHFGDLMHILLEFGDPSQYTRYLFNGDFVDRGDWGPEVLLALYCWKLRRPESVHFNRGNHEDVGQNKKSSNGFRDGHCPRAWPGHGKEMYWLCEWSFKQLPLVHIVGREVAVIHGGLSMDTGVTLTELASINRKHDVPIQRVAVHGYPRGQRVRAKRNLTGLRGNVPRNTEGTLESKVGKTQSALAKFTLSPGDVREVHVDVKGAPELETDVEVLFSCERERERNRMSRIFTALLWSDPANGEPAGPSKRGAGAYFGIDEVDAFLKKNDLRCLLRSHQKVDEGVCEALSKDDTPLAVTVFSASYYPAGAGEGLDSGGNKAAVVEIRGPEREGDRAMSMKFPESWREEFSDMSRWTGLGMSDVITADVKEAQRQGFEIAVSTRQNALEQLHRRIYCARPALLSYFNQLDTEGLGTASKEDWASAMRACVVPNEEFPWEWVLPYVATVHDERVPYATFLQRFHNPLSARLADLWMGAAMAQFVGMIGSPEEAWNDIDRDKNGRLSYAELRPLLRATIVSDSLEDDDRAYTLLSALDKNRNGFVEKEEFLRAMRLYRGGKSAAEAQCTTIAQCWAAVQGVLHVLAEDNVHAAHVFKALDRNSTGNIERGEFRRGIQELLAGSALLPSLEDWEPTFWSILDTDSSGTVSPEELIQALQVSDNDGDPAVTPRSPKSKSVLGFLA